MAGWIEDHIPQEVLDSNLFVFNIKLANGTEVKIDMRNIFDIDFDTIEHDLEVISAITAFYGSVYSELRMSVALLDKKIKVKRAKLLTKFSEATRKENVKLQVDQLKALVESDEDLLKLEVDMAVRQRDTGKIYNAIENLRMKHESLRSLAGFKKQNG